MTMPNLDLAALRMLTLVGDLGSISAAARTEQISQPSASKRIQVLEKQLQLDLLDRRTRGAALTTQGQMVSDWCRTVLDAVDTLVTGSRALAATDSSQVRVAASQTIAEYLVPSWLNEFRRRGNDVPVKLRVVNSQEVIAAVRAHEVDLGFIETPLVPSDLHSRKIASDRLILVVAGEHPFARRRRAVNREELAQLRLAQRELGSGTREALEHALGHDCAQPAIEVGSNTAVKVLISTGDYPAVLSELAIAAELRDGRLVEIPVSGVDLHRPLRAIWRRGTTPNRVTGDLLTVTSRLGRRSAPRPR
jgi:DNA-binding transcriptional LysR family regulator